MSTKRESYNSINEIQDVQATQNGNIVTFGEVLDGLNKNINTLVNEIKKTNEKYQHSLGYSGRYSIGSNNLKILKDTNQYEFYVGNRYYTHGYIMINNSGGYVSGESWVEVPNYTYTSNSDSGLYYTNSSYLGSFLNDRGSNIGSIRVTLTHPTTKTSALLIETPSGVQWDQWHGQGFVINYELD